MKLHFDSNQEYQWDAVKSITDIFEGQLLSTGDFEFSMIATGALLSENGFGNKLTLNEDQVWKNIQTIQQRNEIKTANAEFQGMNNDIYNSTNLFHWRSRASF